LLTGARSRAVVDKKQALVPGATPSLPSAEPPSRPTLPTLPIGSPGLYFTERQRYENMTRGVEASANYLRARADQAAACTELIHKREDLTLAVGRLHALPERLAFEYERTRLGRLSELKLLALQHQLDQVTAETRLIEAQRYKASLTPPPPEPPSPPAPIVDGLTPADIRKAAEKLPELTPEAIETLTLLATAMLAEKRR
jgi:hypothetical protein